MAVRNTTFRFGAAWVALSLSVAIHVTDEVLNGFLEVYNPIASAIRERVPFLPMPTFTFEVWLGGLILGVCLLLALSVFAFRGARWLIPLSYVLGFLMLVNGSIHLSGTVYLRRPMPGVYSSPLLLASSIYLWVAARRLRRAAAPEKSDTAG
jgi:hypothetical protein